MNINILSKTKVISAELNGWKLEDSPLFRKEAVGESKFWTRAYNAPPPKGIQLKLIVEPTGPLTIKIVDRSCSLPDNLSIPHRHLT